MNLYYVLENDLRSASVISVTEKQGIHSAGTNETILQLGKYYYRQLDRNLIHEQDAEQVEQEFLSIVMSSSFTICPAGDTWNYICKISDYP